MKLELYISDMLCDVEDVSKLSVLLRRQFIHPKSLNSKDGQNSYSISLPATANNNEALDYVNVEEVRGKFRVYKSARLVIDGVTILDGKFLLTEISELGYKGNLGIPKSMTSKDVFGTTSMNNAGKWTLKNFEGIRSMTDYNNEDKPECIFPFVLYGLLPQNEATNSDKIARDILDPTVTFDFRNFPPSVNCLQMLEQFFGNAGYNLTGNVWDDERLSRLYVSYKNPNDFKQPWYVSPLRIIGKWTNYKELTNRVESHVAFGEKDGVTVYATDMLKASHGYVYSVEDKSIMMVNNTITIPFSGLYKIRLKVNYLKLHTDSKEGVYQGNGFVVMDAIESLEWNRFESLKSTRHEVKVVRDSLGKKNYDLEKITVDNSFFKNNQNQTSNEIGSIYPKSGGVNFIDIKQNTDMLCGLAWGDNKWTQNTKNPVPPKSYCNPMVLKGNKSWAENNDILAYSVTNTNGEGYVKYIGDNSYENIDEYKVTILNAPVSEAEIEDDFFAGSGEVHQIVWLNEGETVTVVTNSDRGNERKGWLRQNIDFELDIEPFQNNRSWVQLDEKGNSTTTPGTKQMEWGDSTTLGNKELDLMKYLPINMRIDEWIDNFCKAFNLQLTHKGGTNFRLDIKQSEAVTNTATYINLDDRATPLNRKNMPLDVPMAYEMGFTIDANEQGYYESMDENEETKEKIVNTGYTGGGLYEAGGHGNDKLAQTSNFSYCWYKDLKDMEDKVVASVPVITDREVWDVLNKYSEMSNKSYFDKAQRFWFKTGIIKLPVGADKEKIETDIALVSNTYEGARKLELDYGDVPNSIVKEYFLLLNNSSEYTVVSCYLSPDEYNNLKYSKAVFNGDVYNIAEVDKYDPMGLRQCDLKLVKGIK